MSEPIQNQIKALQNQGQISGTENLVKVAENLVEAYEALSQDHFLTSMACLTPVAPYCASRLARLWNDPPAASKPAPEAVPNKAEAAGLKSLSSPLLPTIEDRLNEFLQGLEGMFPISPWELPAARKAECEMKRDADSNISVECTLPGDFK